MTGRASSWNNPPIPRHLPTDEETQMKYEFSQNNIDPYRAGPPDLGIMPTFSRPPSHSFASTYGYTLPSRPSGHSDALEGPNRSPFVTRHAGAHQSSGFDERAVTSYVYPFPSSVAPEIESQRPATAPLTLSQLMPPRRELPFPKETAALTDRTNREEEPDTEEIDHGVGSQKATKTGKARAKVKSKAQKPRTSSSRAKPRPSSKSETAKNKSLPPPLMAEAHSGTRSLRSSDTFVPDTPQSKQTTIEHVMTDMSSAKTNVQKKSSTAVAPKGPAISPHFFGDIENLSPEEYMDRLDHWVKKYQELPAPKPVAQPTLSADKDQLAAYAAQSEEERLKVLDNMICEYLDDENFVKLVEDVDKTWRRIGLGF
ncbi:MAG: hypothetical protein Q9201_002316 [Fulgogasparrea decipioides]